MDRLKTFLVVVVFVLIAAAGIFFAQSKSSGDKQESNTVAQTEESGQVAGTTSTNSATREVISTPNADILYFYGSTCPHCKKVNEFIVANDVDKKLPLQHLETSDKTNASLFLEKQNACKGLADDDKGGVPFLYTPEKCIIGDTPIIDYFKEKLGM